MVSNKPYGTLYTGVTTNLIQRIYQHKSHEISGFTKKYDVCLLVWYECHDSLESAILREKQIKRWNRQWKIKLIEEKNPEWFDLYPSLI